MASFLSNERSAGVLAHITSLPGPFGIGDIGSAAFSFIDFLSNAGQKYWQILPTVPTSLVFDSSPYMSSSAFAGSPLLISPQSLFQAGLIGAAALEPGARFSPHLTDYPRVHQFKNKLLESAHAGFAEKPQKQFDEFIRRTPWLQDYALFMSLKEVYEARPWYEWPEELARRQPEALAEAEDRYRDRVNYYLFEQYIFFSQWRALKHYAAEKNIRLIGDIPIYVGLDSSDVWTHRELFEIDETTLKPSRISGVPPDYFSATGQRWGNPLYRWNSANEHTEAALVDWWVQRFRAVFGLVDVARVDHFRGFESYWAIDEREETAINGTWVLGPGISFFTSVYMQLGELNIIAEDLGEITPEVTKLRDDLGFPGMKVLQFAFDNNQQNSFLPYNYDNANCVVYTGTHDNDTTMGWFLSDYLDEQTREAVKRTANRTMHDTSPINQDLIYLAYSSIAALAVIPLQDLLGFGSDCRMNTPGVAEGNWRWRCAEHYLSAELARDLKNLCARFGR